MDGKADKARSSHELETHTIIIGKASDGMKNQTKE
jgi:hypothetical protein